MKFLTRDSRRDRKTRRHRHFAVVGSADVSEAPVLPPASAVSAQIQARHFVGLFLLSMGTLLLELALTRVLSVSLWYHFGFLVISTALLGFGASGVTLALWTELRESKDLDVALAVCALAFSVSVPVSFRLMQAIPFEPFSVAVDHRQFLWMPLYFLVVALPFFCSGLAISMLLTRGSKEVNRLYGYDLLGAGIGCGAVALVIPRFGGSGSIFVAAFAGALSALCFAWRPLRVLTSAAAVVSAVLLAGSFYGEKVVPIHVSANKSQRSINALYSAWNTLSLVQVVELPAKGRTRREGRWSSTPGRLPRAWTILGPMSGRFSPRTP